MNFKKINTILLFSVCLTNLTPVFGQPRSWNRCVPNVRIIDKQIITSNGDILLLHPRTAFIGEPTDIFNWHRPFDLNYVLISQSGEIKKDTTLVLTWVDSRNESLFYKISHISQRRYRSENDYPDTQENDTTILAYLLGSIFLDDNKKIAYEINNEKWFLYYNYSVDTLGSYYLSEIHFFNNNYFFENHYVERRKYFKLKSSLFVEQFEFSNENKKIKIKNRNIELNKISDKKWAVSGKKWEILLDGSIFHFRNRLPLITLKDNVAYITVFNKFFDSCPMIPDIFPIIYAIDIKKGKIKWKLEILSSLKL